MIGWRRGLAALGAAAAVVLLSGCDLQGGVDVISTDQATIDLLVSDFEFNCLGSDDETSQVRIEPGQDASGNETCHLAGTVLLSNLAFEEFHSAEVGEYWVFDGTFVDGRSEWPDAELEVRFPGDVVESNQGTINGRTLLLNPGRLTSNELRVVVLNRPGPASWVIAAGVGVACGVGLTLVVLVLLRRARRVREAAVVTDPVHGPDATPAAERPNPAPTGVSRPSFAPGPVPHPSSASQPAPGSASRPAPAHASAPQPAQEPPSAPVEVDYSWLAAPPPDEAPATVGPEPVEERPDHSMWAPPENH